MEPLYLTGCWLVLAGWIAVGSFSKIEVTTQYSDDVIPNAFHIRCTPDQNEQNCVRTVVLLQITKDDDKTIAGIQGADSIYYGRLLRSSYTVEGHIDKDLNETYLSVTMREAVGQDSGIYRCHVHYLDEAKRLREDISHHNVTIQDLDVQDIIRHLMAKVSFLEEMVQYRLDTAEKKLAYLETTTVDNGLQLQKLENETKRNNSFAVAFSYGYAGRDVILGQGDLVIFSEPILNVGDCYAPETGTFTAPRSGLYVFHLFVSTYTYGKEFHIDLYVNEVIVSTLFAMDKDSWDQASTSTVVHLEPGHTVKPVVRYNYGANAIFDRDHYSVFSGYLLSLT